MVLRLLRENLPGVRTLRRLYDALPGGGIVKKVVVGLAVAGVIIAAVAAGAVGIIALVGALAGSLIDSSILAAGIIASIPFIFRGIASLVRNIYTFDFNKTDAAIDAEIKQHLNNLYGQVGEVLGRSLGWLACGIVPGALTFVWNPQLAAMITRDMTTEAANEVWGEIVSLEQGVVQMLARSLLWESYKNGRRWLKKPGSPQYDLLRGIIGQEALDKWGEEGSKPWSINSAVEEKVETIEDESWRNFTEELLEGFIDGCTAAIERLGEATAAAMTAMASVEASRQRAQSQDIVVVIDDGN